MENWEKDKINEDDIPSLRIIKTARDSESINEAARLGFKPLVKKVEPSDEIRCKYKIIQNKKTGEIITYGDYRQEMWSDEKHDYLVVIDWTYYYPYKFNSPYAAYLIPKDIAIGEKVIIEDVIEDYVGRRWNQGDTYRLETALAIWNGTDLEIQYIPNDGSYDMIG